MSEEQVLKELPFQHVARFKTVQQLKSFHDLSGSTYMCIGDNNKVYKLRYCNDIMHAKRIEDNVKKLPHWFPPCYGRQGKYILFDWIDGVTLPKEVPPEICHQIGKMVGEAHALNDVGEKDYDQWVVDNLKPLTTVFSPAEIDAILGKYQELKKGMELQVILEFHDLNRGNVLLDNDGKIFFVDEDGFGHKLKGLDIARPLLTSKWIHTDEQREEFWKGYTEHANSDFWDKDYEKLMEFMQTLRIFKVHMDKPDLLREDKVKMLEIAGSNRRGSAIVQWLTRIFRRT